MTYKVVSFTGASSRTGSSNDVAKQLESLILQSALEGWEYIRLESIETNVAPDSGCFGLGAKPGYTTTVQVAVFRK